MREAVTTALDVLGLLAVAFGVFFALQPLIGLAAVGVAALPVMAVSAWWQRSPRGGRP